MDINDEIRDLNDLISTIEYEINFYEEYKEASIKWGFYNSFKDTIEDTLKPYKAMLEVLKAKRDYLISLRGSITYTLSYSPNFKGELNVIYS